MIANFDYNYVSPQDYLATESWLLYPYSQGDEIY
jgi:hypothetical protein